MAKLIPLGNNRGNENRPSDEELNQMFGAFMDAFFGGLSDEDIDEESDDDIIPFDEFDDSDYWDDLYEGPTPFAYSVSSSNKKKRKKPRKKSTDRQVPNYAYKPKGENPEGYFVKKIHSVIRWRVTSTNDVNYDLRVFEGWLAQAQKYVAKEYFYYAVCISGALLSDVLTFHLLWNHDYPKQMARVRKLERAVSEVHYQCLSYSKDKDFNWMDLCLDLLQKKKGSYPFNTRGEAGFDIEDYIEKVIALLPDEKAKQYRDAHPTDKQLLGKPIPVSLPDKIEMPQGLEKEDKAPYITDFIDEIPNAQYSSLIVSLLDIVKTYEKKLKSFGIVKAEELRKMKAEYENFVLAYHRGGIDGFRKYSNYTLTRPFWSIVYNYHFSYLMLDIFGLEVDREGGFVAERNKISVTYELLDILKERGKPMRAEEIRDIFLRRCPTYRHLTVNTIRIYLLKMKEVKSIGLSGYYGLASWEHIYWGTMVDKIYEVLSLAGKPLSLMEIYQQVKAFFPNSTKSSIEASMRLDARHRFKYDVEEHVYFLVDHST